MTRRALCHYAFFICLYSLQAHQSSHIECRAEPNPTSSGPDSISSSSDRPFRDKAENVIIIFDVFYGNASGPDEFTFIVHRSALLARVPVACGACATSRSAPEGTAPGVVHVPWSAWGAAATRWFKRERTSMRWMTRTAGQRAVTMGDSVPSPIIVRDFNPMLHALLAHWHLQVGRRSRETGACSSRMEIGAPLT